MQHAHGADHTAHANALMDLLPEGQATHVAISNGFWFNPNTWEGGNIPGPGAKVLIPEGISVSYAGRSDDSLDIVRVDGNLTFSTEHNSRMVVDTMLTNMNSKLSIGSAGNPVDDGVKVEIIIADNGAIDTNWDPAQVSRGLIAMGEVEMHGEAKTVHLKVADAPMRGDTVLTLSEAPGNWEVGDKIVIAGTHHDDFRANGERPSQDEVRVITAVNGNDITIDQPLLFNHDSPAADLATSVANYTRNIVISSENAENLEANERGHTMFMHNADVDVRYVEFYELGRTDKSEYLDDFKLEAVQRTGPNATIDYGRVDDNNDGVDDAGAMTNIRGRYSVHFHEAGNMESGEAGYMEGNAVWGSPGWGYVNHDSNADFINNAAYGAFGAGFVGETGNETGLMKGNISIYNEGTSEQFSPASDARAAFHGTLNQDMGYAGFGYWFNGRLIELEDNIAAGAGEAGFGWTTRGVDSISPTKATLANDLLARGHDSINHADDGTITNFTGNEVISSWKGVLIDGLGAIKNHNGYNELSDFTGWGIEKTGLEISYSSKYIIDNFRLHSDEGGHGSFGVGIRIEVSTEQVVIKDSSVEDFRRGVVNVNQTNSSKGDAFIPDRDINLVNVDISGNVGRAIENSTLRSVATKVYDNADGFPGHYLNLEFDDSSLRFTRDWADIKAMFPNFWTAIQAYKGQEGLMVRGTKYDSMGIEEYPFGNEMARFDRTGVNEIISEEGYKTLRDGTKVVVLGELITDRFTGETREKYFVTELPNWWVFDGREFDAGAYEHYTGVYRPNFIAANNIESFSNTHIDEIVAARRAEAEGDMNHDDHSDHGDMNHGDPVVEDHTDHTDHVDETPDMPMGDDHSDHGDMDHGDPVVDDHTDHTDHVEETPDMPMGDDHTDHVTDDETPADHVMDHDMHTPVAPDQDDPMPAPQVDEPEEATHDHDSGDGGETVIGHGDHTGDSIGHDGTTSALADHGHSLSGHLDAGRFTIDTNMRQVSVDTNGDGIADNVLSFADQGTQMGLLLRHDQDATNFNVVRAPAVLAENKRLSSNDINGIVDEDFLAGSATGQFEIDVLPTSGAKYANSIGVYAYDDLGNISDVRLLVEDARQASPTMTVNVDAGEKLGFFLVQDGGNKVSDAVLQSSNLGLSVQNGKIQLTDGGAAVSGAQVFVSHDKSLNPDGQEHVLSGADPDNSGGMIIGFEDQLRRSGKSDDDFQDVVMLVRSDATASATNSVQDVADYQETNVFDQLLFMGEGDAASNDVYGLFSAMAASLGVNVAYAEFDQAEHLNTYLNNSSIDLLVMQNDLAGFDAADILDDWDGDYLLSTGWAQDWTLESQGLQSSSAVLTEVAADAYKVAWRDLERSDIEGNLTDADGGPDDIGAVLAASVMVAAVFEDVQSDSDTDMFDTNAQSDAAVMHDMLSDAVFDVA